MSEFRLHYKNKPYKVWGEARHSETLEMLTVYECLYPNDLGTLWVRPKEMFHESVTLPQGVLPRFRQVPLKIEAFANLTDSVWDKISPLLENLDRGQFEKELRTHGSFTILVASFEDDVVGFAVGSVRANTYEIGKLAVRKNRRKVGVGPGLVQRHLELAKQKGLSTVTATCSNTQTGTINLFLKMGFNIVGTESTAAGIDVRFQKT